MSSQLVGILNSYEQIMHDREETVGLHMKDIFLNRFINAQKSTKEPKSPASSDASTKTQQKKKISRQPSLSNITISTLSPNAMHSPAAELKSRSGVSLRSLKLHPIRIGFAKQTEKFIQENSLSNKPQYATEETCQLYDELRHLIVKMLECKKPSISSNPEKKRKN